MATFSLLWKVIVIISCSKYVFGQGIVFPSSGSFRSLSDLTPLASLSQGSETFSLELFQQLARAVYSTGESDFIIAPFSIWSLLVILAEGSAGNTYKQLEDVLKLPKDLSQIRSAYKYMEQALMINNSAVQLSFNQALFTDINRPIDIDFQYKLEQTYEADYFPVNFIDTSGAQQKINEYVKQKTGGKISDIVDASQLTAAQIILVSAIYFQGRWQFPFDVKDTRDLPFYDEFGKQVSTVKMMFRRGGCHHTFMKNLQAEMLALPYGNDDRLSMIVLLPKKNTHVVTIIDNLRVFGIKAIVEELNKAESDPELEVYLPRFSLKSDFSMKNILQTIGAKDLFSEKDSNLSKISRHNIHVSEFMHKAVIQVDEVGTVATAASVATLAFLSAPEQFYVNRPFAFLVIERTTNTLLFAGQVRIPSHNL